MDYVDDYEEELRVNQVGRYAPRRPMPPIPQFVTRESDDYSAPWWFSLVLLAAMVSAFILAFALPLAK